MSTNVMSDGRLYARAVADRREDVEAWMRSLPRRDDVRCVDCPCKAFTGSEFRCLHPDAPQPARLEAVRMYLPPPDRCPLKP